MRLASNAFVALALATISAPVPAIGQESFSPIIGWDDQLFPSYMLATATMKNEPAEQDSRAEKVTLGDYYGVLGIDVVAPKNKTSIAVMIECNEIFDRTIFRGVLDRAGKQYVIYPRIRYHYRALAQNKQSTPLAITFTVKIGDGETEVFTTNATLRSINDCLWAVENNDGSVSDYSFMFAAYVNEQHPFIDSVLREALDDGIVESFTGYQSDDAEDVYRQVYALWNALSERDTRYSSITKSAAANDSVYCQHVRLIDESINNRQANCLDGSVLFASLLRKIGIEPVLVSLPSHCFVAFYLDRERTKLIGLETTMLGDEIDDGAESELPDVEDVIDEEQQATNSWRSFCAAIESGTTDLAKNADNFGTDDPDYQLVNIAEIRQGGLLPIAFDASSAFKERQDRE